MVKSKSVQAVEDSVRELINWVEVWKIEQDLENKAVKDLKERLERLARLVSKIE